ncbi:hypothetical protein C8J57DRAFT_1302425 [Mycena rebaudengoi]|nr:hypothetical protein C8J57DRAFT_1302425 [Mycena rebaudengoi]
MVSSTSRSNFPVLTLPFDIISQIFVCCLPADASSLPSRFEAPLLVAAICKEWREVALATHELWNTIHLDLRPQMLTKTVTLLAFWIPRAGGLPLSMSICFKFRPDPREGFGPPSHETFGTDWKALWALISQHSSHWHSIELHIPLKVLLRFPSKNFTTLKTLSLDCGYGFMDSQHEPVQAFATAPQLRELHMGACVSARSINIPWEQITTLRGNDFQVVQGLRILEKLPNIVECELTLWGLGVGDLVPIPALARLESLTVTKGHTRGPALLGCLTLPALRRLEVDIDGSPQIEAVLLLVARSACFLHRLSVKPGPLWKRDGLTQLLRGIPSLAELEIRRGGRCVDTMFYLLRTESRFLPSLTHLRVERVVSRKQDEELLVDLLESRWHVPAEAVHDRLASFRLHSPLTEAPDRRSEVVSRLRRLREEGMDIHIASGRSWLPEVSTL